MPGSMPCTTAQRSVTWPQSPQPYYGGVQVREGNEEHADAFGHTSGSFWLGEDDLVVVYDVAGDEFVDKLYLLVVEDLFEEPFGHDLVLLYRHSLSPLP
jgi:hypothetical protein